MESLIRLQYNHLPPAVSQEPKCLFSNVQPSNPNRAPPTPSGRSRGPSPAPPRGKPWIKITFALLAAAALAVATAAWLLKPAPVVNDVLTYHVVSETFEIKIPLGGELKAIRNVEIRSNVEGQPTILWIIPEGSRVKEGDELVKLSSDLIKDKVEDYKIRVENDDAAVVNSRELLKIQENQNESDITTAETNAKLAELDYQQFVNGDAVIERETRRTALENAKTDLDRKTEDLRRVKELKKLDYVSGNDVLDADIAFTVAANQLKTAQMNVAVWKDYAEPKQLQTLERKRNESARELERTKAKAHANLLLREADLRAKQQTLKSEQTRLAFYEDQFASCTIKAPSGGMVVYQSSVGWNNQGPIEEGAQVRQNQTLIQLPDTSRMQAEVRLPEQLIERVHSGQEAVITVDAYPGKIYHGKVDTIGTLPDSANRWNNPNLKEYITEIPFDEALDQKLAMKPGFTVKVEILAQRLDDVIAVPLQALFTSAGKSYVYVGTAEKWEKREVVIGPASSSRVQIISGLTLGTDVLLSRPKNAPDDTPASDKAGKKKPGKAAATAPAKP